MSRILLDHLWILDIYGPSMDVRYDIFADEGDLDKMLVGGLEHCLFFHILKIIIPIDELIFFSGVAQPPTRMIFLIYVKIMIMIHASWASNSMGWFKGKS